MYNKAIQGYNRILEWLYELRKHKILMGNLGWLAGLVEHQKLNRRRLVDFWCSTFCFARFVLLALFAFLA